MRRRSSTRIAGVLLLGLFLPGANAASGPPPPGKSGAQPHEPTPVDTLLAAPGPGQHLRLPEGAPDPPALLLLTPEGDTLRQGRDYRPLPQERSLLLLDRAAGLDSLRLQYRPLRLRLPGTVRGRRLLSPEVVDSLLRGSAELPPTPPGIAGAEGLLDRAGLRTGGSIRRGVTVGSGRGLSLESGLRLSMEGDLAPGVRVRALLDDRSLPLQPEGTSARLSDVDRVFVDLEAGPASGRFGDYRLRMNGGRYGALDRRLQGGTVAVEGPSGSARLAGAVTRARFHTNQFTGREGVQGPYRLRGAEGEEEILVIGGSERVWVDGTPMQRGESGDYTVDYARGEIRFTPNRPITSESRIEVDFEYSPETFPRNLYAAEARMADPSRRYRASLTLLQEGDDPENPLGFDLTPQMRADLAQAGDGEGPVFVPGAEEVEPGEADYVRTDTTWALDGQSYTIFRFLPPAGDGTPRGSWRVPFAEVGEGEGEYERDYDAALGAYVYRWVGPGRGAWAAARRLARPRRLRHSSLSLRAEPADQISIAGDFGLSSLDRNTLSGRGDGDNVGLARQLMARFRPLGGEGESVPAELELRWRDEGARYRSPQRSRAVEYARRWGLDTAAVPRAERELEGRLALRPGLGFGLETGGARLEQGSPGDDSHFLSRRADLGAGWRGGGSGLEALYEVIESDGRGSASRWQRGRAAASASLGAFAPALEGSWELRDVERRDGDGGGTAFTGHELLRGRASLGLEPEGAHRGRLHLEGRRRDRQTDASRYQPLYEGWAAGAGYRLLPRRLPLRIQASYEHSETEYRLADSSDVAADLASLSLSASPLGGALTGDAHYRLSRTLTRESVLLAREVPAGQGDYIRVGDEYVYDPEIGDIILRPEPTGEALPTTDLAAALTLDWAPHRLPGGKGRTPGLGWEDLSLVTQLEAAEVTRWDEPARILLLDLSAFQGDSTVEGRLLLRQDLHLFRSARSFSGRLRYQASQRLVNLHLTGAERTGSDRWELRLRAAPAEAVELESVSSWERSRKELARRGRADRFRLLRSSLRGSWELAPAWRATLELRGLADRDLVRELDVNGLGVRPGLVWAVRERGRISADFEALWVAASAEQIAWELADGRPPGRNGRGNLRADLQLSRLLTARALYTVRLDEGRDPIHVARLEASASF